jgi:hypothetical protein
LAGTERGTERERERGPVAGRRGEQHKEGKARQRESKILCSMIGRRPPLWSESEFLATDPEVRVRFPALQKKSSGPGTGSTQPRKYN